MEKKESKDKLTEQELEQLKMVFNMASQVIAGKLDEQAGLYALRERVLQCVKVNA